MKTSVAFLMFSVLYLTVLEVQSDDPDGPTKYQCAGLRELEAKLRDTQEELDNLRKEVRGNRVAFGATTGLHGNFGPFNTLVTLPFKNCYANTGSFNPATGIFTAPVKGFYYFSYSGHNQSHRGMGLRLMKNGHQMTSVVNHPGGPAYATGTNGITLQLDVGDQVYIRLDGQTWIFDNGSRHSTFIGHLLFPN